MTAPWGIVTTVKAPLGAILDFAAWHLDLGAHRIYLHLDAPAPEAQAVLKAHPKLRVTQTGPGYWDRLGKRRPVRHQVRQALNATRVLARRAEVDWLAHIDVDEFLLPAPGTAVGATLAALDAAVQVARVRPIEALAPAPGAPVPPDWAFKAMSADRPTRRAQTERVYTDFARGLDGGFLSHVAGKVFARTTLAGAEFRIHNVIRDGEQNPGHAELPDMALAHMHATDAGQWLDSYRFRLEKGSYRAELKPARPAEAGGMTTHGMLAAIESDGGEPALRHFFERVATATPDLVARLRAEGLYREARLDLAAARARHFPGR